MATLSACTPHPVGPARTYDKYEGKAVTTAKGALSVVETVRQLADAAGRGKTFGPYTSVAASDQEESISRLQATFGSIQPPNGKAVGVRDDLDGLLSRALDAVAAVRIAARQGRLDDLPNATGPLTDVASGLRAFLEAHKG